jgi:hypothetical protein
MRRLAIVLASFSTAVLAPIVPACNGNTATSSAVDAGEGGIGPQQLLGQPCDPTQSNACLQEPCATVVCDITQVPPLCAISSTNAACGSELIDGGIIFEGGSEDTGTTVPTTCQTSADCVFEVAAPDGGVRSVSLLCGFDPTAGCSATGVCEGPSALPTTVDGAVYTACGCDGQPVSYINSDDTAAPVESPDPCPVDAGQPGVDSGTDASIDAGLDATSDAPADAPTDSSDN